MSQDKAYFIGRRLPARLGLWCVGLESTKIFYMSSAGCLSSNHEAVISADLRGISLPERKWVEMEMKEKKCEPADLIGLVSALKEKC